LNEFVLTAIAIIINPVLFIVLFRYLTKQIDGLREEVVKARNDAIANSEAHCAERRAQIIEKIEQLKRDKERLISAVSD